MTRREQRWSWFGQALDAVFGVAGLVLLGVMVARDSYPLPAVFLVLVFAGRVTTGTLERWLLRNGRG